jgi:hypothetical protein
VAAVIQHRRALKQLGEHGIMINWNLFLTVATLVAVLGVYAFGTFVLK